MARSYDQRGTPFRDNVRDLWSAVKNEPRLDGRGYVGGVLHELMNVGNELVRRHSKVALFGILFLIVALLDCRFTFFR